MGNRSTKMLGILVAERLSMRQLIPQCRAKSQLEFVCMYDLSTVITCTRTHPSCVCDFRACTVWQTYIRGCMYTHTQELSYTRAIDIINVGARSGLLRFNHGSSVYHVQLYIPAVIGVEMTVRVRFCDRDPCSTRTASEWDSALSGNS